MQWNSAAFLKNTQHPDSVYGAPAFSRHSTPHLPPALVPLLNLCLPNCPRRSTLPIYRHAGAELFLGDVRALGGGAVATRSIRRLKL